MQSKSPIPNHVEQKKVLPAVGVAIAAAIAANLVTLFILRANVAIPAEFLPLQPVPIVIYTLLGSAGAGGLFALLARRVQRVYFAFHVWSIVALYFSLQPNFYLMTNPQASPFAGGSTLAFGLLIIFHAVAYFACMAVLTFMTRKKGAKFY